MNRQPLEIWGKGFKGVEPAGGDYFLEIDAHKKAKDGVYQYVNAEKGQKYKLTFSTRARGGKADTLDEEVNVFWNGKKISSGFRAAKSGEWTVHTAFVVGTEKLDKLAFQEVGKKTDSTGPFLDSVLLTKYTPPPVSTSTRSATCGKDNLIKNCSFEETETDLASLYFIQPADFPGWKTIKVREKSKKAVSTHRHA